MKSSELRIGNIFKEKYSGDLLVVSELTKDIITFDYQTTEKWQSEPIELTVEILLKCGFYYDTEYLTFCISTCTIQLDDYGDEGYMCFIFGEGLYLIKYLNQLQNIIHALTNEELEINL